ncbi:MAG: PEP-CTERM sorting domain-containing protein [Desulfuromonadales bacterium]|nr:MAG: PEP-CTERM sorting domain-containing protein [Desulfuromonadales bacterium]
MKNLSKILTLATGVFLLFVSTASAVTCASDTLGAYLGLPSTGCKVGGVIFSGFTPRNDLLQTGATPLAPAAITVNPVNGSLNPGLEFVVNLAVGPDEPGTLLQAVFGFTVSGAAFDGATLTMDGASATGDAAVTVVKEIGGFSPLIIFATALDADILEQLTLPSAGPLDVIMDITADGGFDGNGTSTLRSATAQFLISQAQPGVIPEPSTLALVALGFAGFALTRSRRPKP